jgi:hypothetical protein
MPVLICGVDVVVVVVRQRNMVSVRVSGTYNHDREEVKTKKMSNESIERNLAGPIAPDETEKKEKGDMPRKT